MTARILLLPLLVVGLLVVPATPSHASALPVDGACSEAAPPSGLVDVVDRTAVAAVDCAVRWGVIEGTSASTYSPTLPVTRAMLAGVVARTLRAAGGTLPAPGDAFDDVEGTFRTDVEALARVGIVVGVDRRTFSPERPVTRGELAGVLDRAQLWLDGTGFPVSGDRFRDDDGTADELSIDALAAAGIVTGFGDGTFRPTNGVTRVQTALYLGRWMTAMTDQGLLTPIAAPIALPAQPAPTPTPTPPPSGPSVAGSAVVVVASGASAQGQPGCTSTACRFLDIYGFGFAPESLVEIVCEVRRDGVWDDFAFIAGLTDVQGRVAVSGCYFGFPGAQVRGVVQGVASEPLTWTWS